MSIDGVPEQAEQKSASVRLLLRDGVSEKDVPREFLDAALQDFRLLQAIANVESARTEYKTRFDHFHYDDSEPQTSLSEKALLLAAVRWLDSQGISPLPDLPPQQEYDKLPLPSEYEIKKQSGEGDPVSGSSPNTDSSIVSSSQDPSRQIEAVIGEGRSTRRRWMGKVLTATGAVSAITALASLHPKARHMLGIAPDFAMMIHDFPKLFPGATVTMKGDLEHPTSVSILIYMPRPLPNALDLREQASRHLFPESEQHSSIPSSHAITHSKSVLSSQENPIAAISYCIEHCSSTALFCSRDFDAWSLETIRQWMKSADQALLAAKARRDVTDPEHVLYRDAERDYQMKVAVTAAYRKELEGIFGPHARALMTQENFLVSHLHPDFYNTDGENPEAFDISKIPDVHPASLSENLDAQSFSHNVENIIRHRIISGKTGTSIFLCAPEHLHACSEAHRKEIGTKNGFATIIIDIDSKAPPRKH